MAFATVINTPEGGNKKDIDFEAMNEAIIEQAGLQERETLIGVVSVIADLGTQNLPDAEMVFTGNESDEEKEIEKNPNTYFKTQWDYESKKEQRFKCYPQKPQQCVAFAVDFPDIVVDKGIFFGESKPLPLRIWMGGQFYIPSIGMVVQRPTPLKVNKKLHDTWSLDQKHLAYKMAVAAKIIKPGEVFLPSRIDELLGQAFQFETQVYMKDGKDGKSYFTEYIKFVGGLGRGMKAPETSIEPSLLQFNEDNKDEDIQTLRNHIINTMKQASNYSGSKIEAQIDRLKGTSKKAEPASEPAKEVPAKATKPKKETKPKVAEKDPFDDMDDDIPFN